MKRLFAILSICLLFSLGDTDAAQAAKARELRMNVTTSETSVWMVGAREFKRLVEERTQGRYKISIFPNEQLSNGDLVKGLEMLFTGITDVDIHGMASMTVFEPKLNVVNMPWIFTDGYASVDAILYGKGGEELKKLIEPKGAIVLGFGDVGFRQLTNNKRPVRNLDDMAQLKIRTPSIASYIDVLKSFGADPTAMNFAEVFTALQQGTIDGQENPLDTIRSAKIQEVQKYLTMWNWAYDPIVLSVSSRAWKRLSDEDKKIFRQAGAEAMQTQREAARKIDQELLKEFQGLMEVNILTPEEIDAFRKACRPIYEKYRNTIGEDLFKTFGYAFN